MYFDPPVDTGLIYKVVVSTSVSGVSGTLEPVIVDEIRVLFIIATICCIRVPLKESFHLLRSFDVVNGRVVCFDNEHRVCFGL